MTVSSFLWFAEYSNVSSIIVVAIFFVLTTIFIGISRVSENGKFLLDFGVKQRNMVKLENPFFLQLQQENKELKDGFFGHISTLCGCRIFILWGPKINPVHDLLLRPGTLIWRNFAHQTEAFLQLESLHFDCLQFSESGDHNLFLPCPSDVSPESLGSASPRDRYPLVIFAFVSNGNSTPLEVCSEQEPGDPDICDDCKPDDTEQPNYIIGLVSIVHLKDNFVTQKSNIIGQYIKTSGVPVYSLQPLYIPNSQDESQNLESESCPKQGNENSLANEESNLGSCDKEPVDDRLSEEPAYKGDAAEEPANITTTTEELNNLGTTAEESMNVEESQQYETHKTELRLRCGHAKLNNCDSNNTTLSTRDSDLPDCVVCQAHKAVCVILPCRHACVCSTCFNLLDKCPMCRGVLECYFLLDKCKIDDNEDGEENLQDRLSSQAVADNFSQMWHRLNNRLNQFFGFN